MKQVNRFFTLLLCTVMLLSLCGCGLAARKSGEGLPTPMPASAYNKVQYSAGYAEEAMAAARKAGAGGGTVIGARGTPKEGDAKFFGMEIVPEKEMLMILVPTEKKDDIINAIKKLECFSKAGSGIVFCNGAGDFTLLGKN